MYHCRDPMARFRTILAFLVAPLAIPVGLALVSAVFPGSSPVSLTDFFGLLALYSYFALHLFELAVGLPLWLFLRRRGIRDWSVFAGGGIALGAAYWLVSTIVAAGASTRGYDIYSHSFTRYWFNPMALRMDVPAGFVSAIVFRAIVLPKESRENPKQPLRLETSWNLPSKSASLRHELANCPPQARTDV
jgi:hypothetical protein